jgi:dienelactone hydrolase
MTGLMRIVALGVAVLIAQDVRHFDYDANAPLGLTEIGVEHRAAADVHDITYASPKGGRVPAYLVVPKSLGGAARSGPPIGGPQRPAARRAAVIWGHWYWENSPQRNRTEFLDEAVALAQAGVVSLLTDGPIARPGHVQDKEPLSERQVSDLLQQVIDMRRGVDLLLARNDVDAARIAYVGHSYNAMVGAILSGVDRRFKAFVLMAGTMSDEVDTRSTEYQDYRQKMGPEKYDAFMAKYSWLDQGKYVSHAAPAVVFLQYGSQEKYLTPERAREYEKVVSEPKRFTLYDAPHALNAEARRDRIAFLTEQLKLKPLPPHMIAAIPDLFQPPDPK